MMQSTRSLLAASALALGAAYAAPAGAIILVADTYHDGSFDQISYGNGAGGVFITPFLYTSELASAQPAATQVQGAGIGYAYSVSGSGTSALDLTYSFTNAHQPGDLIQTVSGLRFMLSVLAVGDVSQFFPTDKASQSWPAKAAGDPDKRQIQDWNTDALNNLIVANSGLTDGANNCAASGCIANLGLEWDLASLANGSTWTIHARLLDQAAGLAGGRYLRADSVDIPGNLLIVGNPTLAIPEPETYALLLPGLLALGLRRRRSRR